MRASFLPGRSEKVTAKLDDLQLHTISLSQGAVLETGCVYVVPLLESLALPDDLSRGDQPEKLHRPPRRVHPRHRRRRFRLRSDPGRLRRAALRRDLPADVSRRRAQGLAAVADPLPRGRSTEAEVVDDIPLSVDLVGDKDGLVGYRAKRHTGLVDVDVVGGYPVLDYWEPIHVRDKKRLILDPDQFYILASKEAVRVPPTQAAEMVPFNPLVGEFRVHYAGFFDPGFGHAAAGGEGATAVLEVRSHKVPFILEDGQTIGRLVYERLSEAPKLVYGRDLASHYQAQGLKLSKHFK